MIDIALIGAGLIGSVHADSLIHMPEVQLRAVCDIQYDRALQIAKSVNAIAFADIQSLIASPVWENIDVVLVCVPTYLHEEMVVIAATHKKHIFCEKPIALTEVSAARMIEVCAKNQVLFGVGHVVRFFPEYVKLREQVVAGGIGEIGTIRTFRGGVFPYGWDSWYGDEEKSGGILVDLLIHDLDFIDAMINPIEQLFARRISTHHRKERDYALVVGRLRNGAIFHMEATWAHSSGFRYGFEYAGSRGMIEFDSEKTPPLQLMTKPSPTAVGHHTAVVPESPFLKSPYQVELEAFLAAVQERRVPPITGETALRALQLSLAARRSAQELKPILVQNV